VSLPKLTTTPVDESATRPFNVLRLPPPDRVRRRPPQDAGGQDPPHRAASGGAGGERASRQL